MPAEIFRPVFGKPQNHPQEIAASNILHNLSLKESVRPGEETEMVVDFPDVSVSMGVGAVTKTFDGKKLRVIPVSFRDGMPQPLRMNLPEEKTEEIKNLKRKEKVPQETRILFKRDGKSGELIIEGISLPQTISDDQLPLQILE